MVARRKSEKQKERRSWLTSGAQNIESKLRSRCTPAVHGYRFSPVPAYKECVTVNEIAAAQSGDDFMTVAKSRFFHRELRAGN